MTKSKNTIEPQTEARADLTHVYTLIHSFLKERSHIKAASALKKAVNGVITIDDNAVQPNLQKILEEWRELKAAADAISDSSSDSSDQSSSDDSSEIENDVAGKRTSKSNPCKTHVSRTLPNSHLSPADSSDDTSSSDDDDSTSKAVPQVANLKDSPRDSSKTLSSADDADSDAESTSEDSDSNDESDVDMDSGLAPRAKEETSKRKTLQVKKPATSSSDTTSSSSSDSDSSEGDQLPSIPKRKAKPASSSDSSSSSDSDSDEDSKPPTAKKSVRNAAASSSSDSSSDSDSSGSSSSESSSNDMSLPKKRSAIQAVARSSASSASSSSGSEDELEETPVSSVTPNPGTRATKKLRANMEGTAVITSTTAKTPAGNARGSKASRKPNTPFQRVNAQTAQFCDERLKDNSFESRGARADDYGARANQDLIVTRGDGFRKEKNKKKRGSYRGGDITLQSHSFKFED